MHGNPTTADAVGPQRSTFSMRTGVAHLRSVPPAILLDLATQQAGPDVLVTPILHEVIHHACANTAVNVALQYRWLELLRLLLSSPGFGYGIDEEHIDIAADLAAAEAILQPLAEGIAHFSEFDCVVPESRNVRSVVFGPADALLWRLLSLKAGVGSHVDELWGQLRSEQLTERTIARKTDVLCNPVRPATGNDSYLLGYLTLKALWNRFVAGRPEARLRAPSFLNFVMYYVYEDWELARILLASPRIAVDAVAQRVAGRVKAMFSSNLAEKVAAFTDDVMERTRARDTLKRGPEEREHGAFRGLDVQPDAMRAGMLSLVRFYLERIGPAGAIADQKPRVTGIRNLTHGAMMMQLDPTAPFVTELLQRHHVSGAPAVRLLDFVLDIPLRKRAFCYLMDVPVGIRGQGGTRLLLAASDDPTNVRALEAAAAAQFSSTPQPGRLVGVITSTDIPWRFYCFLLHNDAVVCSWTHGGEVEDADEQRLLAETIVREVQLEASTQLPFTTLNDYLTRNAQAHERVGQRADAATCSIAQELRGLLLEGSWRGLMSSTASPDFGVRNLLSRMSDVRCLAAAGLCNAFRRERSDMEGLMRAAGYRWSDALAMSEKVERESGVTLVVVDGDEVHVHV